MKRILCALSCAMFVISGCTATDLEGGASNPTQMATMDVLNNLKGTPESASINLTTLVRLNFAIEQSYQQVADRADAANHFSNAFLLTAALGIALGELGSASSSAIERQILGVLGINEGFKYANMPQVARAYRIAAREALCFVYQTEARQGDTNRGVRFSQAGSVDINHNANASKLIIAMRNSHSNLRTRLMREPVGFLSLLEGLRKRDKLVEREDSIEVENKLAVALAQNNKDDYMASLLACLQ